MTHTPPSVGLAITTLNRRDVFNDTLDHYLKHTPTEIPIIVIDDGSDTPVPETPGVTIIRNDTPKGVARAKNQCIAALMDLGCEHLMLSDDDCYPTEDNWWTDYTESGEHHLSLQLRWTEHCPTCQQETLHNYNTIRGHPTCGTCIPEQHLYEDNQIHAVQWGSGVFQYFTRHAINTIGGYRTQFGRYGGEHLDIAYRAHNAGLTRYPFQDVLNPKLYGIDAHSTGTRSCIPEQQRRQYNARGWQLFEKYQHSSQYIPYLEHTPTICIPWRPTRDRLDAFDHCVTYWRDNGYTVKTGDSPKHQPFTCGIARNNAAKTAHTDIVIIADGDTIPENINQITTGVELVRTGQADVVWPFNEYRHIDMAWAASPHDQLKNAPIQQLYTNSPGGIFIMRKETLDELGGFDERFTPGALGFDDTAFSYAAQTLTTTARVPGTVYSFNHATRADGRPDRDFTDTNPNKARFALYEYANGKPHIMAELIKR